VRRGPIAEINLSAISHNLHLVQRLVNTRPVIAVVKADAYGHGAVPVSRKLLEHGIAILAVAFAGEAKELRESGIDAPILVLFDHGDVKDYFELDLIPAISTVDLGIRFSEEARKRGRPICVHVKIDSGMGRLGLFGDDVVENVFRISEMPGIELSGLFSHFSEADLADNAFAREQLGRFLHVRERVRKRVGRPFLAHIANSAAVLTFEQAHLDAVRPGIILYGCSPFPARSDPRSRRSSVEFRASGTDDRRHEEFGENAQREGDFLPAMTIKAKILDIRRVPAGTPISYGRTFITKRPSTIGVLAIGYADGYNRFFSNNADVIVNGQRVPVVGRVCMDLTMVDLTDVPGVTTEDDVIIMGQDRGCKVTADELARRAGTISYEILTSLGRGAHRVYVEAR